MSDAKRNWDYVSKLGLTPLVSDLETYNTVAREGAEETAGYFQTHPIGAPKIGHYRIAHKLIFEFIHPWAGRLRSPGEEVSIAGFAGCISGSLPFDSNIHDAQCRELFDASDKPADRLLLAAFTHARFTRMHPFTDGNGRSSRTVCDAVLREMVGKKGKLREFGADYKQALFHAQETNDLGPLMREMAARSDALSAVAPKGEVVSPFEIAPGFYTKSDVAKGVERALQSTRTVSLSKKTGSLAAKRSKGFAL